jgi:hypothetical protein
VRTERRCWTAAEREVLLDAHRRATLGPDDVGALAGALQRSVTAVRAQLGRLGLRLPRAAERSAPRRRFATGEERRRHRSELMHQRLAEEGHPRGFLGRRHSAETRAELAAAARRRNGGAGRPARPSWVYFLQADGGGPVKIGRSANPQARVEELQQGSPVQLRLLAVCRGGHRREAELHRQFAAQRLHGEWFRPGTELLAFVGGLRG